MKDLFNNILGIEDVQGVMLFSFEGRVLFGELLPPQAEELEKADFWPLLRQLARR